jgi:ferritin
MMKPKVLELIGEQIRNELESAYLYLSMAAYFHSQTFDGMAKWMRTQVHEETAHAMKLYDHVVARGEVVKLQDLKQRKTTWSSVQEAWEDAYKHEQFVTGKIHELLTAAREAKDYAVEGLLQWYVKEQVEEEASSARNAELAKRVGDSKNGMIMLDHQLGHRASPAGSPFAPAD